MPFGLSNETAEKIREIFARHPEVRQAILYGSRAMGTHRDASDIDLTLTGKDLNLKVLARIETELDDLLLPFQFDLSIRRQIKNESLLNHIDREGVVFYEREVDLMGEHAGDAVKPGWEVKRFAEVLEIRNGKNQRDVLSDSGTYPIYGSAGNVMGMATDFICEAGTTIIGRKGNINSPVYTDTPFWNVDTAFGLSALKELDSKFLFYFCLTFDFGTMNRGTTIPSLVKSELLEIKIPLPPLPEQQRIVAILDEAFAGIATAKANTEQNLQNARAVFDSHLNAVFSQRGEGWVERRLEDIADFKNGLNFTRHSKGQTLRMVGVGDFQDHSVVQIETVQSVTIDGKLADPYLIRRDDILTVRSNGSKELVGRCMLVPDVDGMTSFSGFIIRIRFDTQTINPRFLLHYMKSRATRDRLMRDGGGANISNINQAKLSELPVSLPPSKQQEEIADRLDFLSAETQRLAGIYERKLAALAALKKSLLHQAFAGEL